MAATAPPRRRGRVTGTLLRFVSCGLASLAGGALWRLTLAPARIGVGSALAGILFLLIGFIVGGLLWYLRDARARTRDPGSMSDDEIIFSFVVFALTPLAVATVVGLVWLMALLTRL